MHGAAAIRVSADVRREQLVEAAVIEFATYGLHGTSTEKIAKRVKISQPYVFRLFPTKKDLFLAAIDSCFDRVEAVFRLAASNPKAAGHSAPEDRPPMSPKLHAMGHAYADLLSERQILLFQMQAYAACSDDKVRRRVAKRWASLVGLVTELSGARRDEVTQYFARGMLLNVIASMGMVPHGAGSKWAHDALGLA